MGCPVHVWVPLMAAAAPVVRVAKDRVVALRYRRAQPPTDLDAAPDPAPTMHRWAPIDPHRGD